MTLLEWQDQFATENACQEYLFQQRWPTGFVCPQCQGKTFWTDSAVRPDRASL